MTRQQKILIGIPVGGGLEAETSSAIVNIMKSRSDVGYFWVSGSPIEVVRSKLVRQLLASDATHLLMMDSDIIPPANIIDLLLECNWSMAAAIVPIVTDGVLHTNIHIEDDNGKPDKYLVEWDDSGEPFEVKNAGTGCCLYRREVFETIEWPWFRFLELNAEGECLGEDIYFGEKAANYGFTYKVHPKSLCGHKKKVNLLDILNAVSGLQTVNQSNN